MNRKYKLPWPIKKWSFKKLKFQEGFKEYI